MRSDENREAAVLLEGWAGPGEELGRYICMFHLQLSGFARCSVTRWKCPKGWTPTTA